MDERFVRTVLLLGEDALARLAQASVLVCGLGGVGSYAAEALARSGVGQLTLLDHDQVAPSNINRQLLALSSTVGKFKADIMAERARDINPAAEVRALKIFYSSETADQIFDRRYDFVLDAIDTVGPKVDLICRCQKLQIPCISALGTGNKLDPSRFEITDISQTSVCPLARVVRYELRKRGVENHTVLYSKEPPTVQPQTGAERPVPGSNAFTPPVAGLLLARHVVLALIAPEGE